MSASPALAFPKAPRPMLPVVAAEPTAIAVRRVVCVGRNYAAHARELGNDPREPPFFFHKPADALVPSGSIVAYPPLTKNLHHEVELVMVIGKGGANIAVESALGHVYGYAVGLDLTRRDLQFEARDAGRPWDAGKSFDQCAPCSAVVPAERIGHPTRGRIWLTVNGTIRQDADLAEMTWNAAEIVAAASRGFALAPGDVIFTGTPAGVSALVPGDRVVGAVEGVGEIVITIGAQ